MRQAGVLLPLFSIRSPSGWGLGEIPDLVPFARWASSAGFALVQVLPVTEAARGQNSPYSALSAFAIDPVYLAVESVEDFAAAGGVDALPDGDRELLAAVRDSPRVRWRDVRALKHRASELAFRSFLGREWHRRSARARELEEYRALHASWVCDYALFVALHDDLYAGRSWGEWDDGLRAREPSALASARASLSERVLYRCWLQWQLDLQWHAARRAVNEAGAELMGDLPFMVATDSADVWSRPFDFRLDARAGVPPDAFSAEGQDWGLPVYRWDEMAKNGLSWIGERARRYAELYGAYRVDHVVGYYRSYFRPNDGGEPGFVPSTEPEQVKNGERVLAAFARGARVIAEDLGVVPEFVRSSLASLGIPGYRVLRWEKDAGAYRDPARWPAASLATSGTHDTDSLADWYESLEPAERKALLAIPGLSRLAIEAPERYDDGVRDALLELLYQSRSDLVLVPLQDAMGWRDRVNVPGTVNDLNWSFRVPLDLAPQLADTSTTARLRSLAERSGRVAPESP
ncbi:MAG TPA: 4-alpha-glucanotransferase [Anaeromyxobacteraceae bacterium]|nr:4-alpha-glucanotransferase [Anaeromyxobacteraceae bacterium]